MDTFENIVFEFGILDAIIKIQNTSKPDDEHCDVDFTYDNSEKLAFVEYGWSSYEEGECVGITLDTKNMTIKHSIEGHDVFTGGYSDEVTIPAQSLTSMVEFVKKQLEDYFDIKF